MAENRENGELDIRGIVWYTIPDSFYGKVWDLYCVVYIMFLCKLCGERTEISSIFPFMKEPLCTL